MKFTAKAIVSGVLAAVILAGCVFTPSMHVAALLSGNRISKADVFFLSEESSGSTVSYKWVDSKGNEVSLGGGSSPFSLKGSNSAAAALPSSYDARNFGYVTSVKSQGQSGCCWAFSVMGTVEAYDVSHGAASVDSADYSESHLIWFTNRSLVSSAGDTTSGDGVNYGSPYDMGGNWQRSAATLARWSGVADEADYPFIVDDYEASGNYAESARYINNGRVLRSAEELTESSGIKQAVMNNGAVSVAMYYDDSCLSRASNGDAVYYGTAEGTNHAVMIIGWDDNYPASSFPAGARPSANGAYLIKNSWAENWGNGGYAWVSYETVSLSQFAAFATTSGEGYDHNYQYDGFGYGGSVKMTNGVVANVFTASSAEKLKAVGVYTFLAGDSVAVSVYKNIPAGGSPGDGTLEFTSGSYSVANPGYHMLDLSEEIALEPGERFAVAIKYEGETYFPCEPYNTTNYEVSYSSNEGESYYSFNPLRYGWSTTASSGIGNVCIKAFTADAPAPAPAPVMPANAKVVGLDYVVSLFADALRGFFETFFVRLRESFAR